MLYQLLKTTHSLTAYIVLVVLCFAEKGLAYQLVCSHIHTPTGYLRAYPIFCNPSFPKLVGYGGRRDEGRLPEKDASGAPLRYCGGNPYYYWLVTTQKAEN